MSIKFDSSKPKIEINLKLNDDLENDPTLIDISNVNIDPDYEAINNLKDKKDVLKSLKYDVNNPINNNMIEPNLILVISGKRKSGKDHICQRIVNILKNYSNLDLKLITLSSPLKKIYALEHNLDYQRLLDSSDYKEKFRIDMIRLYLLINLRYKNCS